MVHHTVIDIECSLILKKKTRSFWISSLSCLMWYCIETNPLWFSFKYIQNVWSFRKYLEIPSVRVINRKSQYWMSKRTSRAPVFKTLKHLTTRSFSRVSLNSPFPFTSTRMNFQ